MSEEHESTERYIRILETRVAELEAALAQIHARGELSPTPTTGASSEPQREEKA